MKLQGAALKWARHLLDVSRTANAPSNKIRMIEAVILCLRLAISLGQEFKNWDEAKDYLAGVIPGYQLDPADLESVAGGHKPFTYVLGFVKAHIGRP